MKTENEKIRRKNVKKLHKEFPSSRFTMYSLSGNHYRISRGAAWDRIYLDYYLTSSSYTLVHSEKKIRKKGTCKPKEIKGLLKEFIKNPTPEKKKRTRRSSIEEIATFNPLDLVTW